VCNREEHFDSLYAPRKRKRAQRSNMISDKSAIRVESAKANLLWIPNVSPTSLLAGRTASSLPWNRVMRNAPCFRLCAVLASASICCVWFLRAHSRSNKLLGAGSAAAPSRMHLYPSQVHWVRLAHYSLRRVSKHRSAGNCGVRLRWSLRRTSRLLPRDRQR
jgi:hypothetical protein